MWLVTNLLRLKAENRDYKIMDDKREITNGPLIMIANEKGKVVRGRTPKQKRRALDRAWKSVLKTTGWSPKGSAGTDYLVYVFSVLKGGVITLYVGKTTATLSKRYGTTPPKKKKEKMTKIFNLIGEGNKWMYTIYNTGQPSLFESICVQKFEANIGRNNKSYNLLNETSTD